MRRGVRLGERAVAAERERRTLAGLHLRRDLDGDGHLTRDAVVAPRPSARRSG